MTILGFELYFMKIGWTGYMQYSFDCYRVRCHIVHLSSAKALPLILEARKAGAPITVETTHHYLCLDAETTPNGATQYKCCPPIRSKSNQAIWPDYNSSVFALFSMWCCGHLIYAKAINFLLYMPVVSDGEMCGVTFWMNFTLANRKSYGGPWREVISTWSSVTILPALPT